MAAQILWFSPYRGSISTFGSLFNLDSLIHFGTFWDFGSFDVSGALKRNDSLSRFGALAMGWLAIRLWVLSRGLARFHNLDLSGFVAR